MDRRDIVYALLQLIPPGYTVTYSLLAKLVGTSPRAIGVYMRSNRQPVIIPCHRVVRSDGSLGGYSAGGPRVKRRLLELEGVSFEGERVSRRSLIDSVEEFWRIVEEHGFLVGYVDP